MSNKKIVCSCGKDHGSEQPLVITITTCPKKKHCTNVTSTVTSPKKALKSVKSQPETTCPVLRNEPCPSLGRGEKSTGNEGVEPSDHILICEDEGLSVPPKCAAKPLIDSCVYCDLDNEAEPLCPGKAKNTSARTVNVPVATCDQGTESEENVGLRVHEADRTFFDPSHSFDSDQERFLKPSTASEDANNIKSRTIVQEKPTNTRMVEEEQQASFLPPSKKVKRDEVNNYPSDIQMALPVVLPRYHGPGCTMEVDVLEKHDDNCRYRKEKNPERNPADDRSGSYEVIGRLRFRTCQVDNQNICKSNNCTPCPHDARVATIYSLFNIPYKITKPLFPETNESEQQLQKYLTRKKLLEDLVKSSKSFPNVSKRPGDRSVKNEKATKGDSVYRNKNVTPCDVEVLYFYGTKHDKSIQISKKPSKKFPLRKLLYYIFPCVTV